MDAFIEKTLLWTKADGLPGILDDRAVTPEHLAKLEAACREIEILPETFVGDEDDDADDRARLLERRWRSPFSNDGTPEDMKVLKARAGARGGQGQNEHPLWRERDGRERPLDRSGRLRRAT